MTRPLPTKMDLIERRVGHTKHSGSSVCPFVLLISSIVYALTGSLIMNSIFYDVSRLKANKRNLIRPVLCS